MKNTIYLEDEFTGVGTEDLARFQRFDARIEDCLTGRGYVDVTRL